MRKYETIFISDPDLKDHARSDLFEKVRNVIVKENGLVIDFDDWGNKKLAYEIKKKSRGHYVCVTYGGTGDLVNELERNFRLTDDVLKFMTIVLSEDTPAETFEKEIQIAQEKKEAQSAAEEKMPAEEETPAEEAPVQEEKPAVKEETAVETQEDTE